MPFKTLILETHTIRTVPVSAMHKYLIGNCGYIAQYSREASLRSAQAKQFFQFVFFTQGHLYRPNMLKG